MNSLSNCLKIHVVASSKFEEFRNECPHYTPSKVQGVHLPRKKPKYIPKAQVK